MSFSVKRLFLPPYTFQKIVIYISTIVFVITMILIGMSLYSLNKSGTFPPNIAQCPDYFKVIGKNKCQNVKQLGTCPEEIFDFEESQYKGVSGLKNKYNKAIECGWVWDGITNNSQFKKVQV